ncbi:MAG: hypothetical protein AAB907_03720 [Patescibacteria group bacterium]
METAIIIVAGLALVFSLLSFLTTIARSDQILSATDDLVKTMSGISDSIEQIVESKQLSTILIFDEKKDLGIKPEDLKAKREALRDNLLESLEEQVRIYSNKRGRITDPDTASFCTFNHSGFESFVTDETKKNARKALTRILANQNIPAAKRFLTRLAANL